MNSYNKNIALAGILIVLVVGSFSVGKTVGVRESAKQVENDVENSKAGTPVGVDFAPFWKAWDVLNEKFVPATTTKTVTDQDKAWGAIEGLASSLNDPYTVFLPPVENEIFESDVRGNFEGVGIEIAMRDGLLTVVAPLKGTPAYNAGVKSGDRIIKIGDKDTRELTIDESITLIRGKRCTPVTFTIAREGADKPIEITVLRDTINIPTIDTQRRPDGVFVISLYNFSSVSPELFRGALREFIDAKTDKLLLDLRGNPGGYLEASISMASWFLPPGKVVVREDFGEGKEEVAHRSLGYDIFNDKLKFVILVDEGSASASEILAGALREHGVAKIVGEKTFGKGSVQELVPITPETSLKVTIARWLTPNGVSISDGGVKPDVEAKLTEEDIKNGRDWQMEKAAEVLLNWSR